MDGQTVNSIHQDKISKDHRKANIKSESTLKIVYEVHQSTVENVELNLSKGVTGVSMNTTLRLLAILLTRS